MEQLGEERGLVEELLTTLRRNDEVRRSAPRHLTCFLKRNKLKTQEQADKTLNGRTWLVRAQLCIELEQGYSHDNMAVVTNC